ncbi:MAG: LysM peptidoglycan-binding domain-containing protein [Caldilineae bacterium]|nr:MAG: LysM peptidoglycan-binding domain-containing protein [Caldilineae bacterium]
MGEAMGRNRTSRLRWSLILILVLLATAGGVRAQEGAGGDCGDAYTVQAGDTWESIAQACGVSVPGLRSANPALWGRQGAILNPGDALVIPDEGASDQSRTGPQEAKNSASTAETESSASASPSTAAPAPVQGPGEKPATNANTILVPFVGGGPTGPFRVDDPDAFVHRVRLGEYWILIADKYGVSYPALREANQELWAARGEVIRPGDEMIIPGLTAADMPEPVEYVVQPGDSWRKIADLHGVSFWELKLDNIGLWARRWSYIQPGDVLVISSATLASRRAAPAPSAAPPGQENAARPAPEPAPPAEKPVTVLPTPPQVTQPIKVTNPPPGSTVITVRPGDSWYAIADYYGVSFIDLRNANPVLWEARGQRILPGDEMIIPPHGSPPPPPEIKTAPEEKEPAAEPSPTPEASGPTLPSGSYTVQEGDTWASIAAQAGVTEEVLKAANVELSGSELTPGAVIRIP